MLPSSHISKIYHPTIESKKAKPIEVVYWICLCKQEPWWHQFRSALAVLEARERSKAYKRSHNETINQILPHHTWSLTGRAGPQARLGSPSSTLPARPSSSLSPRKTPPGSSFPTPSNGSPHRKTNPGPLDQETKLSPAAADENPLDQPHLRLQESLRQQQDASARNLIRTRQGKTWGPKETKCQRTRSNSVIAWWILGDT